MSVASGHHIHDRGGIAHRSRERSDAVQRRGEGDEPMAGNAAVGWHQSDAAEGSGLANGAAGIGAEAALESAATAAAEPPLEPPGTRSSATGLRTGP